MNEILGVSRIGVRNYFDNALGSRWRQRLEKVGGCLCLYLPKPPKSLIVREFKVLFNESHSCIVSQGSSLYFGKQHYVTF